MNTAHQQKGRVADSVSSLAGALRQTGHTLEQNDQATFGNLAHQAADRLDQFSNDLQSKSVDEIFGDVQDFARRDPQLFLGGAMVLGLLAARFFKSSARRSYGQQFGGQRYGGYQGERTDYGYSNDYEGRYSQGDLPQYRRRTPGYEHRPDYNAAGYRPSAPGSYSGPGTYARNPAPQRPGTESNPNPDAGLDNPPYPGTYRGESE